MSATLCSSSPKNTCSEVVTGEPHLTDTPPSSHQVSKLAPVADHLIPLPDTSPSTPDVGDSLPNKSPYSTLPPQETGGKNKLTPGIVQDSNQSVEQAGFASIVPPNVRPGIEPCWSKPPPFSVQTGGATMDERLRKAFCAQNRCPRFPVRSHAIPTPASFEEIRESLLCRAKLKRAGYRFDPNP